MSSFNKEFASLVLLTALYFGDKSACEKHQITQRTLYNYRTRLTEDSDFSAFFHKKKEEFLEGYEDKLALAIDAAADLIIDAPKTAAPTTKANPEFIHAMAGAIKICGEVLITRQMLKRRFKTEDDARNDAENRTPGSVFGQDAAAENDLPN